MKNQWIYIGICNFRQGIAIFGVWRCFWWFEKTIMWALWAEFKTPVFLYWLVDRDCFNGLWYSPLYWLVWSNIIINRPGCKIHMAHVNSLPDSTSKLTPLCCMVSDCAASLSHHAGRGGVNLLCPADLCSCIEFEGPIGQRWVAAFSLSEKSSVAGLSSNGALHSIHWLPPGK